MADSPKSRKTSRSHVTTACISCRSSKLKCDGNRPQCSRCLRKGASCEYPVGEDKRKVSLQNAIPLLLGRIDELSQFIEQHGLKVPPIDIEGNSALSGIFDTRPNPYAPPSTTADGTPPKVTKSSPAQQMNRLPSDGTPTQISSVLHGTSNVSHTFDPTQFNYGTEANFADALNNTSPQSGHFSVHSGAPVLQEHDVELIANDADFDSSYIPDPLVDKSANMLWDDYLEWELLNGLPSNSMESNEPELATKKKPDAMVSNNTQLVRRPSAEEEVEDDVITSLSQRLGVLQLAADGQLRYYGATSNFNLLKISLDPHSSPEIRSVRNNGQEVLERAQVGATINQELEDHVINLYFAWQDPSYHVVDRKMFESAKRLWDGGADSPYYSEVLKNAMCALGSAFEARFHPSFPTFPKPLAEYFGDRAKTLLDLELDSPTVATVQALVILSSHEAAHKRDARGWLYSGMAMRLAQDLGLHVDDAEAVRLGQLTPAEAAVRRTAFWGCFVSTHLWSFYLGRDFRVASGDTSVKYPSETTNKQGSWRAYSSTQNLESQPDQGGIPDPLELVSRQWVILCETVGALAHVMYGCIEISKPDLQVMCSGVTDKLWAWKENLCSELQIEIDTGASKTRYLPHILMLHMQYYSFQIFLHRPWTSKTSIQPFPPQGAGPIHARGVCIKSAVAVAQILRMYEKHYTFRLMNIQAVHIIFTSIPVLIFATMEEGGEEDFAEHLGTCFRALEVLGSVFDSAKRAHGYLLAMQRMWPRMKGGSQLAKRRKLV